MLSCMEPKSTSPLERLRHATRATHDRIDSGPYAKGVMDGSLPIARYASFLRALRVIHVGLAQTVETAGDPAVLSAFAHGRERIDRLTHDLTALQLDPHGTDAAALHAHELTRRIQRDAQRSTAGLFGHMYVLEGSQLGGLSQRVALTKRPELQHGGLAYLSGAGRETLGQFKAFCAQLEASLLDEPAIADAVSGALHAFESIEAIVNAVTSETLFDSSAPEAGFLVAE
jgi:heme oxygenase